MFIINVLSFFLIIICASLPAATVEEFDLKAAWAFHRAGNYKESVQHGKAVLALNGKNASAHEVIIRSLVSDGQASEALDEANVLASLELITKEQREFAQGIIQRAQQDADIGQKIKMVERLDASGKSYQAAEMYEAITIKDPSYDRLYACAQRWEVLGELARAYRLYSLISTNDEDKTKRIKEKISSLGPACRSGMSTHMDDLVKLCTNVNWDGKFPPKLTACINLYAWGCMNDKFVENITIGDLRCAFDAAQANGIMLAQTLQLRMHEGTQIASININASVVNFMPAWAGLASSNEFWNILRDAIGPFNADIFLSTSKEKNRFQEESERREKEIIAASKTQLAIQAAINEEDKRFEDRQKAAEIVAAENLKVLRDKYDAKEKVVQDNLEGLKAEFHRAENTLADSTATYEKAKEENALAGKEYGHLFVENGGKVPREVAEQKRETSLKLEEARNKNDLNSNNLRKSKDAMDKAQMDYNIWKSTNQRP